MLSSRARALVDVCARGVCASPLCFLCFSCGSIQFNFALHYCSSTRLNKKKWGRDRDIRPFSSYKRPQEQRQRVTRGEQHVWVHWYLAWESLQTPDPEIPTARHHWSVPSLNNAQMFGWVCVPVCCVCIALLLCVCTCLSSCVCVHACVCRSLNVIKYICSTSVLNYESICIFCHLIITQYRTIYSTTVHLFVVIISYFTKNIKYMTILWNMMYSGD